MNKTRPCCNSCKVAVAVTFALVGVYNELVLAPVFVQPETDKRIAAENIAGKKSFVVFINAVLRNYHYLSISNNNKRTHEMLFEYLNKLL